MNGRRETWHHRIFLFGLLILIVGIPTSHFLMSVGQLLLSANWIAEGKYLQKLRRLSSRKGALVFLLVFAVHLLGLILTENFSYALKDLRIKLPLFVIPFILASSPGLQKREIQWLLMGYAGAVVFGSIRSVWELWTADQTDIRQISVFISHIRFSLNICLAIFILLYAFFQGWFRHRLMRSLQILMAAWLMVFLYILQAFTGIAVFAITLFTLMLYYAPQQANPWLRFTFLITALLLPIGFAAYIWGIALSLRQDRDVDYSKLDRYSAAGSFYHHDTLNRQTVNGYPIWIYLADSELEEAWNVRSEIAYDSTDREGNQLRDILIRYLTSKGLRKDAEGLAQLSDEEVNMIEEGTANRLCSQVNAIKSRICEILWEYENYKWTGNPSGHSVLMRWEYWKTGWHIVERYPAFGVGTGDIQDTFQQEYERIQSPLSPEWRLRSHNQYLSIWIALGVLGLLVFLFALFYPALCARAYFPLLFRAFLMITILSMITEDTLETQAGATFVAFFYAFLLWGKTAGKELEADQNMYLRKNKRDAGN